MPFYPRTKSTHTRQPAPGLVAIGGRILSAALQPLKAARGGRLTTHADRYRVAVILSVFPLNLGWLLHLFGSDKQKAGGHAYGVTYQALMRRFRYKRVRLLEIGVLSGASLLAWRAFFPRGTFTGCDIERKDQFAIGRILTRTVDQGASSDLRTLCDRDGPFDIIIDDGSHQNAHQISTFYGIFDRLADDGLYIIEDVQTSFWPGYFGGAAITDPAFAQTCVGEFQELAKYLNYSEFVSQDGLDDRRLAVARKITRIAFEHNLIIIQKGNNDEASNLVHFPKADLNRGAPAQEAA